METGIATISAAFIAAFASIVAAILSNRSKNVSADLERKMKIRQARLDERDLILKEDGFLIPVENDDMWQDYSSRRQDNKISRKEASENVINNAPSSSNPLISERLSG